MQLPLQVTFRDMPPSPAVEARVREMARKLDRFSGQVMSCRVVIEIPHKHHHKGNLYRVRVLVTVPEGELVADRSKPEHHESEDVYVAIRDAFKAVQRQLEDRVRVRRGKVKNHEAPPHGQIELIAPTGDHGRIGTFDGRDVYFHRNSVINADFESLKVGMPVLFTEEMGDEGPQATAVTIITPQKAG